MINKNFLPKALTALFGVLLAGISPAFASEADLVVPKIQAVNPDFFTYLLIGIAISVAGLVFGFVELNTSGGKNPVVPKVENLLNLLLFNVSVAKPKSDNLIW